MMRTLGRDYGCPVEFTVDALGGKWKTVILARLKQAPMRFGELRALIPTLSDKMLSERLRDIVALGLAETHEEGGVSRYRLTPRGASLQPVLQALYDWGSVNAGPMGAHLAPAS
jgi:DNA-binding HxlR family transcriptional regulator